MLRPGDLVGGFEVLSDPAVAVENRHSLWRRLYRGRELLPIAEEDLWVRGVDPATGATVWISPRGDWMTWGDDLRREALARGVMALALPGAVPVLHVGSGVVHAEPPAAGAWPTLALADAAACTLAACEVAAHVHALGYAEDLRFGPGNLRVLGGGRIAWIVPGIATLAAVDEYADGHGPAGHAARAEAVAAVFGGQADDERWDPDPVRRTLWGLAGLFFGCTAIAELARERGSPRFAALEAIARTLLAKGAAEIADVAGLARVLMALVDAPAAWAGRVAALPAVRVLPAVKLDWDAIIADGETLLATPERDGWPAQEPEYLRVPLAAAYHQRASRAFAAGDHAAALDDATRAVEADPTTAHRTTRAVILDAMGRLPEAWVEIEEAFAGAMPGELEDIRSDHLRVGGDPPAAEGRDEVHEARVAAATAAARAYATRGSIALRMRAYAQAEDDLRHAWELRRTACHAEALGAVLYARGHVYAASVVEAEAVALAPEEPRHRWALMLSLVRLRRIDEARAHADALLRLAPGVYEPRVAQLLAVSAAE